MFRFSPPSGISQIRTCRADGGPRLVGAGPGEALLPLPWTPDLPGKTPPGQGSGQSLAEDGGRGEVARGS